MIELLADGQSYSRWTRYEVDQDLRVPAGDWRVSARAPSDEAASVPPLGSVVELRIGGIVVLWGRVEEVESRDSREDLEVTLSGWDAGGLLVQASANHTWRWSQAPLSRIAAEIAAYAGVARGVAPLDFDPTVGRLKAEPGESCWDLLERAVVDNGLRLWALPDGRLTVSQVVTTAPARGALVRRRRGRDNNVIEGEVRRSFRGGASEVIVLQQFDDGSQAQSPRGTWSDTDAPFARRRVVVEHGRGAEAARRRAEQIGLAGKVQGFEATYAVRGHVDAEGVPWRPNTLVRVVDESRDIDEVLLVVGRTFSRSIESGTRTRLTLVRPQEFAGAAA